MSEQNSKKQPVVNLAGTCVNLSELEKLFKAFDLISYINAIDEIVYSSYRAVCLVELEKAERAGLFLDDLADSIFILQSLKNSFSSLKSESVSNTVIQSKS